jgi:hypothetical protein
VKVDDCCDPSSVGILTCVKLLEYVCKCVCHRLRVTCINRLLFYFFEDV